MKTRIRATAVLGLPAVVVCCSLPGVTMAAASTVSPLPASDYMVRPVCAAPAPDHAGCLALRLVPVTAAARAHTHPLGMTRSVPIKALTPAEGGYGLRPQDLLSAYSLPLPPQPASTQTIAIVDAYNDLGAEADLEVYDKEFKLPECTEANKCFKKVNQNGETANLPFPQSEASRTAREGVCKTGIEPKAGEACKEVEEADGWAGEISLDIEIAHAVCQNCRIVLVEANSSEFVDLDAAEVAAEGLSATEISNSWGGPEQGVTAAEDDTGPFNHPGTVITVAAGDNGYLDWSAEEGLVKGFADYPASSPHVVAVGGTHLNLTAGRTWKEETVWNGNGAGGGGCSTVLTAPAWQQSASDWLSVGCGEHRAVADVSADADPFTGVAIYDSTPESMGAGEPGWVPIGGTSLASPLIASVFALAGGAHGVEYPAETLYENLVASPSSLHDVVFGSNGQCNKKPPFNPDGTSSCTPSEEAANSKCSSELICLAGPGYDGPSGVGTPNGIVAFQPLTEEAKRKAEEQKKKAEETKAEEQKRKEKAEEEKRVESLSKEGGTGGAQSTSPAGQSGGSSASANTGSITIQLSGLTLTPNALVALNRTRPKVSLVAFAFTINVAAHVQVTLAKRVRSHGRAHWQLLRHSLTIAVRSGRNNRRLRGHNALTPGLYRLTLTPVRGTARSLVFQIG